MPRFRRAGGAERSCYPRAVIVGARGIHQEAGPDRAGEVEHLKDRAGWLVRLRWFAIAAVAAAVAVAVWRGFVASELPLVSLVVAMGAANVLWVVALRRPAPGSDVARWERVILAQLTGDVVALAALLHWSDGVENPFSALFVFHAAIGAMLLPRRMAFALGAGMVLLHLGIVLAETRGWLQHHPFLFESDAGADPALDDVFLRSPALVLAYSVAFAAMVFGTIYFVQSVTERRRAAEMRERERERLAVSRERMAHIGELSAGVAHSIRNPLHGLINCVDILAGQVPSEGVERETLELMSEGLSRIEVVTRRLLALTRDAPLQPCATDLGELADDVLRLISLRSSARELRLELSRVGAPRAWVDPDRLNEALVCVLDNAVDASSPGSTIAITVSGPSGAEPSASISVEDHGSGLSATDLEHVFDPFFTTKAVGQGTGLGLAITKRIVEEHGGILNIESVPGAGTRVRMLLPAAGEDARGP